MTKRFAATAGRRDANEAENVAALLKVGATVERITTGGGVPDLLVGFRGDNYLMEVKHGTGKLNPEQSAWHKDWCGDVGIVRSVDDALIEIGVMQRGWDGL